MFLLWCWSNSQCCVWDTTDEVMSEVQLIVNRMPRLNQRTIWFPFTFTFFFFHYSTLGIHYFYGSSTITPRYLFNNLSWEDLIKSYYLLVWLGSGCLHFCLAVTVLSRSCGSRSLLFLSANPVTVIRVCLMYLTQKLWHSEFKKYDSEHREALVFFFFGSFFFYHAYSFITEIA